MIKALLKKQLTEIFRSYFYNTKKNKARSKGMTILMLSLFALLMVVVLGGIFAGLSYIMCVAMIEIHMEWLFFTLMGIMAIFLGAFGSVFNTYSSLYLAKDNDLLLSMPIPVRCIMFSRLLTVYLMGLMYSAVVIVPAVIVYWCLVPITLSRVVGGLVLVLMISLIVLILSCLLGWVVAKISTKLKNKKFITVLSSLVIFVLYYVCCYRSQAILEDLIQNAAVYGAKIKTAAYPLYAFGSVATGSWSAMLALSAIVLAVLALTYFLMARSFIQIATASGQAEKIRYRRTAAKVHTPARAMVNKELARFTGSAGYMLNCGMGTLLLPLGGIMLLIKGREMIPVLNMLLGMESGFMPVLLCAALFLLISMNDMAAPSVSLEGKTLWLSQSLPIHPWLVLRAKVLLQVILTGGPALFCAICAAVIVPGTLWQKLLVVVTPLLYMLMMALLGVAANLKMPNLTWTSEMTPIKQSGSVFIALMGGWLIAIAVGGLYLWQGWKLGATMYLALTALLLAGVSIWLTVWLKGKGAKRFAAL